MGWEDGDFSGEESRFDDYELGGGVADGANQEKFEEQLDNAPPVGERTLLIKSVTLSTSKETGEPQEQPKECFLDGQKHVYHAMSLQVEFAWKDDLTKTIREFFVFPPGFGKDPERADEVNLYMKATREDVKPTSQNTGFHWRKLKQFLMRVGFPIAEDGQISSFSVKALRCWPDGPPREVVATIVAPKPDPKRPDAKLYKGIKLFSFASAESTLFRMANKDHAGPIDHASEKAKSQAASIAETLVDVDI